MFTLICMCACMKVLQVCICMSLHYILVCIYVYCMSVNMRVGNVYPEVDEYTVREIGSGSGATGCMPQSSEQNLM